MEDFLFKYRNITNNDFDQCYNLQNLINHQATISSRKLFNDPYDSRFDFEKPTFEEFKKLRKQLKGEYLQKYKLFKNSNGYTKYANNIFEELEKNFNLLIDNYGIYSLTNNPVNEAMWAHYASNHEGFCIKFNAEPFNTQKVQYADEIPKIKLFSMLKGFFNLKIENEFGQEIFEKLLIKKKEWVVEQEYRFIMSGKLNDNNFIIKPYTKDMVEAVIFGYNMKSELKKYILEKTDFKFLQAVLGKTKIEIVTFDENKHL